MRYMFVIEHAAITKLTSVITCFVMVGVFLSVRTFPSTLHAGIGAGAMILCAPDACLA